MTDLARIDAAVEFVRAHDTSGVLAAVLPTLTAGERDAVAERCQFSHTAALVFPADLAELSEALRERGLVAGPATPSVVVRRRLALRHRRPAHRLDVRIVRAAVPSADGKHCDIELFVVLPTSDSDLAAIAEAERPADHEQHLGLAVRTDDEVEVAGLCTLLTQRAGMRSDGGGYNGHENLTVLYFRTDEPGRPYRRLELHIAGEHPQVLAAHRAAVHDPRTGLLRLLTGAWATQALAVTAALGVADRLAAVPGCPVAELAAATGADGDSLHRLLRYLTDLDVVRPSGEGFALTEGGALLAATTEQSLHPLALLYGGAFYQSFAHLEHAVRTGRPGFDHHFGSHHFDYFTAVQESAELFDAAMAASASVFGQVADLIDLTGVRTVVDVAGGNGALLSCVLTAEPRLRGVLFERASTLVTARAALERADCLERCELIPGDFTREVPGGGDLYLLSRVLHDWDDDRCRQILATCAAAMPAHARLYVVERLLPDGNTPSLAPAWDVHMLCNVGGRERTRAHYGELFAAGGLVLGETFALPMDFTLMQVVPAGH
ncbi:methyltransferase [Nocardia sp. NPDC048505]|uniref:methyltransferase n=1 Tax=Nocardia sp. NPDC048505 TaxID=3155756 RepID=UPI0033FF2DE5